MFDEQEYQTVFSKVTASDELHRRVKCMAQTEKTGKEVRVRRIAVAVLTVILLASISMTVVAAVTGVDWFEKYFQKNNYQLSESQRLYIEQNTVDHLQSVTHNGYTVSVKYAITDGYVAYIMVELSAPDGVSLDADGYGFVYQNKSQFYPVDGSNPSRSIAWHMERYDNDDSRVYFPMVCHGSGLDAGTIWILELKDLVESTQRSDGFYDDTVIAEGTFRFELVLSSISHESVELLTEPMPYKSRIEITDSEFLIEDLILTSIVLRPLSAEICFEGDMDKVAIAGLPAVVMKDGSTVEMGIRSGGNGETGYQMDIPIILEDVDYVLLPNGTKIPMPNYFDK